MPRPTQQDQIFQRLNELQARAQAQEQSYQQQLTTPQAESDHDYDDTQDVDNAPITTQRQTSESKKNIQKNTKQNTQVSQQEDDFDLLGGLPDEEEDYRLPDPSSSNQNIEPSNDAESTSDSFDMWEDLFGEEEYQPVQPQSNLKQHQRVSEPKLQIKRKDHRELPQRGRLDIRADEELDRIHTTVPIRKFGKNDGIYLFGTRTMKLAVDSSQGLVVVIGTKKQELHAFVRQFEKVETLKLKGLGVKDMFAALNNFGLI